MRLLPLLLLLPLPLLLLPGFTLQKRIKPNTSQCISSIATQCINSSATQRALAARLQPAQTLGDLRHVICSESAWLQWRRGGQAAAA